MTKNIITANRIRDVIGTYLKDSKVLRLTDYFIAVDYMMVETQYKFNLRVKTKKTGKTVLSLLGDTGEDLLSNQNLATLLLLYNS